jgi:23S rRNA (cytidine1920-2'-O)/16S rRNA (cytidine1409-2'-O)-methyltransferase
MAKRLDIALVEAGFFPSREQARRAVLAGDVRLGDRVLDKPGRPVEDRECGSLVVRERPQVVSRGYHKLAAALEAFPAVVSDRVCLDVGSSTGGFTQCLLDRGASLVFAVDCGTNQLDWRLRRDARVRVMEKTNARLLEPGVFSPVPELVVMDVSFISLGLLFPVLGPRLGLPEIVCLVKPQFEAGRHEVGKGGIVRDPAVHRSVLLRVIEAAAAAGYAWQGLIVSPLCGADGNREFLLHLRTGAVVPGNPETHIGELLAGLGKLADQGVASP